MFHEITDDRRCRHLLVIGPVALVSSPADGATRHLPGTDCPVFPADNYWHADVSELPVHARSDQWLSHMSPGTAACTPTSARRTATGRSPTASRSPWSAASHAKVPVSVRLRRRERPRALPARRRHQDRGRPLRPTATGTRSSSTRAPAGSTRRSRHVRPARRRLDAGSGAMWSLTSNKLRPHGWTSADAAGLPILPGLLRSARCEARPRRPRDPLHHRRHRPAPRLAGPARRGLGQRPGLPADGRAVPAQGVVPDLRPTGPTPRPCCGR